MATAQEVLGKAIEAGVRLAFGTDSGVYPHGLNGRQFASLVDWGLSPLAAIRSATIWAADLLGWRDRIGALEPGLQADLVAVAGDPLARPSVLEDVGFVMQAGRIVRHDHPAG
jgi:imidazolonepropionase-like amidohydrolase